MKIQSAFNKKGITLIELLVALAISAIVLAGVYQLFISQTRTYAKQDQVVEVQQSVRTAMEILSRDLRMVGFDDDNPTSTISIPISIVTPVQSDRITLNYEYCNKSNPLNPPVYEKHTLVYWVDANSNLRRKRIINDDATHYNPGNPYVICHDPAVSDQCPEIILTNVTALTFTYGVDANIDGVMDDLSGDGIINAADYVTATVKNNTYPTATVVAIRVALTGGPNPINQDVAKVVSPRTLISAVTLRNKCLR